MAASEGVAVAAARPVRPAAPRNPRRVVSLFMQLIVALAPLEVDIARVGRVESHGGFSPAGAVALILLSVSLSFESRSTKWHSRTQRCLAYTRAAWRPKKRSTTCAAPDSAARMFRC